MARYSAPLDLSEIVDNDSFNNHSLEFEPHRSNISSPLPSAEDNDETLPLLLPGNQVQSPTSSPVAPERSSSFRPVSIAYHPPTPPRKRQRVDSSDQEFNLHIDAAIRSTLTKTAEICEKIDELFELLKVYRKTVNDLELLKR